MKEPRHSPDSQHDNPQVESEPLKDQVRDCIEEGRMVLPGIQALFGFQLIAVFNEKFGELGDKVQLLHYVAVVLVTIAIALIMTPAAFHRIAERGQVSQHFVDLASQVITWAMLPFAIAIALDVALVGFVITESWSVSGAVSVLVVLMFATAWFAFPLMQRRSHRTARRP